MTNLKEIIETAVQSAVNAGLEILKVYETENFDIEYKQDESPLTRADKNSHNKIMSILENTGYPVLSEEGNIPEYEERKNWTEFWCIDPLDGTKEFIKRNGDFTVNIAFIRNQKAIAGVIYVPVTKELYFGDTQNGAYKIESFSYSDSKLLYSELLDAAKKLPLENIEKNKYTVVASRSHMNKETADFIEKLKQRNGNEIDIISRGSSLKLCMVAEGKADIYPRFAPTMEWDTAAGSAIVNAAGGKVINAKTNEELLYNKENLLNPWFIVER